jgi:hypothetical protein
MELGANRNLFFNGKWLLKFCSAIGFDLLTKFRKYSWDFNGILI